MNICGSPILEPTGIGLGRTVKAEVDDLHKAKKSIYSMVGKIQKQGPNAAHQWECFSMFGHFGVFQGRR